MPKTITFRAGLGSVLFWSIISAAFIGPGSVTACALAGATHGLTLLWAITFSTVGTIVLQEAAARLTLASGLSLGECVARTTQVRWLPGVLFGAVALGCGAFQAGNILGAVAGLRLLWPTLPAPVAALGVGALAALLLWTNSTQRLAQLLGVVVFGMGAAFAYTATEATAPPATLLWSAVWPALPTGSAVLVMSLIGTTIVPYNLFLASGIGKGQSLTEMRWGIGVAVALGGLISAAILLTGTLVSGEFSFGNVAQTLGGRLGPWASGLFAFGLFAAGFTSALTAPLAAAVTAQGLLGVRPGSATYRFVWGAVLAVGLAFGVAGVKPVPVIVLAQAVNGVLLPFVALFLFRAVNHATLLGEHRNRPVQNVALAIVVGVTAVLGGWNVWLAVKAVV